MRDEADRTEPVDPDIDLRIPAQRRELAGTHGAVLGVVGLGGGIGAVARYGIGVWWPVAPRGFPWATFTVNVLGCLLIGVLMVLLSEVWPAHRLARPFLGVGVLGGFTTFSTYAVETLDLLRPGTVGLAFAYLAGTLLAALFAVIAGVWLTRAAVRPARTADPEVAA